MKLLNYLFLLLVCVGQSACDKEMSVVDEIPLSSHNYLFLGHIYEKPNTIDPRIEFANRSAYQQFWLGGDVCSETTQQESTLDYLDALFDLDSPNTHWTVGNHDIRNGNESWITTRTGRKTYYATHFNGITMLVLNTTLTEPDDCDRMEDQYELIRLVCDTISTSSHLIVLTHHVVWGEVDEAIQPQDFANVNGSWLPFSCNPVSNPRFDGIILSELIKVQERGTSVICVAGDLGQEASTFDFTDENGILYLGSGITSETEWNQQFPTAGEIDYVLRFNHDLEDRELTWEFVNIDDI